MRSPKWKTYTIPGGHIDFGETMVAAVKREIKEEVGLDIYDLEKLNTQECIFPEGFYKKSHFIFTDFSAKTKGEPKLDQEEATSFVWVTPEEGLRISHEYVKDTIKAWMKKHDTNRV